MKAVQNKTPTADFYTAASQHVTGHRDGPVPSRVPFLVSFWCPDVMFGEFGVICHHFPKRIGSHLYKLQGNAESGGRGIVSRKQQARSLRRHTHLSGNKTRRNPAKPSILTAEKPQVPTRMQGVSCEHQLGDGGDFTGLTPMCGHDLLMLALVRQQLLWGSSDG